MNEILNVALMLISIECTKGRLTDKNTHYLSFRTIICKCIIWILIVEILNSQLGNQFLLDFQWVPFLDFIYTGANEILCLGLKEKYKCSWCFISTDTIFPKKGQDFHIIICLLISSLRSLWCQSVGSSEHSFSSSRQAKLRFPHLT